ncbi:unnamed protein product [Rhizophagus irregularis]|nr:unnamed protein product [Rhizophagus irregularis]
MLKIKYPGCTAWTSVSVTAQKKRESPADIWYGLGLATHLINNKKIISSSTIRSIITRPLPKSRSKFAIISCAGTRPQPPPRVTITIKDIVLNIKISLNIRNYRY